MSGVEHALPADGRDAVGEAVGRPDPASLNGRRPVGEPSDVELTARLREGDPGALALLYDRHATAVHGLTRAILRDGRLAEEATHDVFLGLWQQPAAYDPMRGPFAGWLLRVARNRAIDLLRRHREQPFAAAVSADGTAVDPTALLVDPDPDPADQVAAALVRQDVRRALAHLTAEQRRLLELAYFGGMTQREIALHVNRPLGTVKTQIRVAMQRLAGILGSGDPASSPGWGDGRDGAWEGHAGRAQSISTSGGGGASTPP